MNNDFKELRNYSAWMKQFEFNIVDFNNSIWDGNVENIFFRDFKPFREGRTELENGMYITIRCGLPGVYTFLNEWKDGNWQRHCLDGSYTIAYRKLKDYEEFDKENDYTNNSDNAL